MKSPIPAFALAVGLATFAVAGCSCKRGGSATWGGPAPLPSGAVPVSTGPAAPTAVPATTGSVLLPGGAAAPLSFAALVKACDPSVVTVFAREEQRGRSGRRRVISEGLGSGFIYDAAGYILTNNHVVADATDLTVRLADERRLEAKLVGRDPQTDVAILKIDVTGAPFLPLGDSNALDVGDWVVAIGNPFGLSHTVSAGIISAKGRTRSDVRDLDQTGRGYFNFLQTDAAINQGNSGGPLINLRGEVVGINTAIRANANNIGFAIPINMVRSLIPFLTRDGKVNRSALGVSVEPIREEDVARLHRPNRKGAMVRVVSPGGPADKAGLASDDVVLSFNGTPVNDPEELRWLASIAGVGSTATVRVARGERVFDVKVTLGALPDDPTPPAGRHGGGAPGGPPDFPGLP